MTKHADSETRPGVGTRLEQARALRGLSRAALADAIGKMHTNTIKLIETGKTPNPGIETLNALARVLHVSDVWLCFGRGEIEPSNGQLDGWDEAEALALGRFLVPDAAVWWVRNMPADPNAPNPVTPEYVRDVTRSWIDGASQDDIDRAETSLRDERHRRGARSNGQTRHRSGEVRTEGTIAPTSPRTDPAASRRR